MKQLYVQNKRVLIDENTYFPFTHTISDLENVEVMSFPTSKTINLPRCKQNDDVFGHIAEITRINVDSSDNKIGLSFNQIKKCEYVLYDENIVVSKGLVIIESITESNYEVTLYDQLIQKLEELDGDEDTGEYFLTDIDLFTSEFRANSFDMKHQVTGLTLPIVPVLGIKDNKSDLDSKIIRCNTKSGSTYEYKNIDLPTECTSLQLRTVKAYEFNYACPLSTTIAAINSKYGNTIKYDDEIKYLMDETYMLLNQATNEENAVQGIHNLTPYSTSVSGATYRVMDTDFKDVCNTNGNKVFDLNIQMHWTGPHTSRIGGRLEDGMGTWDPMYYTYNTINGDLFSKLWAKVYLYNNSKTSPKTYYEIDFIRGENAIIEFVESSQEFASGITLNTTLPINLDFYPEFDGSLSGQTYLHIDLQTFDPSYPTFKWKLSDGSNQVVFNSFNILSGSTLTETALKFRSNDRITTEKIMPKLSIKSFIMQLAKFFNLDITIENDVLKLIPKTYYLSNDRLIIDSINNISTNNITFNRLKLSTGLPKNDNIEAYKTKYKSPYGSKVIDTGYSIKKSTKEITLDTSIPVFYRDYNSFTYQNYAKYMNGGYSKNNYGLINDLDNKLTLCYVNKVTDKLYITDDTPFEGGLNTSITGATEAKFVHYNPWLTVDITLPDNDSSKYKVIDPLVDLFYGGGMTEYFWTVSPYYFENNVVVKSLEMSRPQINYCGLTNDRYLEQSTLYYLHHRNMLIDKYNHNTHIIDCNIYINGPIDLYKIYNYHNSFYIISDIIEYDPTIPNVYNVKLMRVNDINNYVFNKLGNEDYLKAEGTGYLTYDDNWKIIINEKTIE